MKTIYLVIVILSHGEPVGISSIPMLDYDTCQFGLHQMQEEIPMDKLSIQCLFSGVQP